jgi:hypothetical protein
MRKKNRLIIFVVLAVLAAFHPASGKTRRVPLPDQVMRAKTVFIDNRSVLVTLGDKAYDELAKWGRFRIVATAKDADMILVVSASAYVSGYDTTSTGTAHGTTDTSGNTQVTGSSTSHTEADVTRITYLTAIDPKTGDALWSDAKRWGNLYTGFHSATRSLLKELRQRIEEQEAESKSKGK